MLVTIGILGLLLLGVFLSALYAYEVVRLTKYDVYTKKINDVFDGYKMALITDFHNSENYPQILEQIDMSKPDVILIAGDLVSMNTTDYSNTEHLLAGLVKAAPTYYAFGNHEIWSDRAQEIAEVAKKKGVHLLNDQVVTIKKKNNTINLAGFMDIGKDDFHVDTSVIDQKLDALYRQISEPSQFSVLLFHRANYFDTVANHPFDLVLSGHLHNGQVNLPFVKKWILKKRVNNDQYSKGLYRIGDSQMVVSGGLEKSRTEPRIYNPAEVVLVTLHKMN